MSITHAISSGRALLRDLANPLAAKDYATKIIKPTGNYTLIISQLEIDQNRLVAKIDSERKEMNFPENLWFSVRNSDEHIYPNTLDAFVIGMLPIAMKIKEDITLEGPVSSRLAYGITHYQAILSSWWPQVFTPINIHYKALDIEQDPRVTGTICTFSGGVDSFYSVLKHLPSEMENPSYQLTHAMMINGFDQLNDPDREGSSQIMFDIYAPLLDSWGVKLLMVDTNLRIFRDVVFPRKELPLSQANPLSACAHIFGKVCSRFLLAGHAAYRHTKMLPSGSHPVLDHHLGSDALQIIHADSNATRAEKIAYIANYSEVQKNLRVCFGAIDFHKSDRGFEVKNCCKCEKCLRTFIVLDILGKAEQSRSFRDPNNFNDKVCFNLLITSKPEFLIENLELAKQHDRQDWIKRISQALQYQYDDYNRKINAKHVVLGRTS
jgi:hypothetical protein